MCSVSSSATLEVNSEAVQIERRRIADNSDGLKVFNDNQQMTPRETSQWNQLLPLCGLFQPYRLISCPPFRAIKLD